MPSTQRPGLRRLGVLTGLLLVVLACLLPWTRNVATGDESVLSSLPYAWWVAVLMTLAVATLTTGLALARNGRQPRLVRGLGLATVALVALATVSTPRPDSRVYGATADGSWFEISEPTRLSWAPLVAVVGLALAVAALCWPVRTSPYDGGRDRRPLPGAAPAAPGGGRGDGPDPRPGWPDHRGGAGPAG